jgi:hypothetical protein
MHASSPVSPCSWKNWLSLVGFWACVLGIKIAFDYFVLIAPMVEPVSQGREGGRLPCCL